MDAAARILIRSACKLLVEAMNRCDLDELEEKRVHAAYRRLMLALLDKD